MNKPGFLLAQEWQAGLHYYDAIMVGKQTIPMVAASDDTEANKIDSMGIEYGGRI